MKAPLPLLFLSMSVLAAGIGLPGRQAPKAPRALNFNRDVKPILSEHCFKCHGPDVAVTAGGLRLDTFAGATKLTNGHAGIVPGKPAESRIWKRMTQKDPELRMPPPNSGVAELTPEQLSILKQWIASGAKYEEHWSFVPPKRPVIPNVSDFAWTKNFVDRFVMARLDKEGLRPEPEADRATLMRRASLALTGLLPTPEEVDRFVSDRDTQAYEKLVDRLLASPAYGEHQARYWLDAVRYGDTHGLHLDNERGIYPYRDWVVQALNKDLPFDQFTTWQLAGDLLPQPTTEQLVATGYVRMNPTTSEGGAIEDEFLAKNTFDRVDTTSTVFLGMTVGCARCHDHKFDPVSQKDYFRMYAYFNSTADKPLDGNEMYPPPVIRAANAEQDRQLKEFDASLGNLLKDVSTETALAWLGTAAKPPVQSRDWQVSTAYPAGSFDDAFATAFAPEKEGAEGIAWKALDLKVGQSVASVVDKENAAAYVRGTISTPKARELTLRIGSDDGVKVWLNGKLVHENKALRGVDSATDEVKVSLKEGDNAVLIKVVNGGGGDGVRVGYGDPLSDKIHAMQERWTKGKPEERKPEDLAALFLQAGPDTPAAQQYRQIAKSKETLESSIPMTLIAQELPTARIAHILRRGEYNLPGEKVDRGIPAAMGTMPSEAPTNRLGFAKWLVSEKNPLVSRVFVNRLWQQHFGTGLVKTAEDFGSQGEWPVNPALLDYLAVTFREKKWSVKSMHRLLVTSAAFRQRSTAGKEKLDKDPENRLASRGPRFRLDGEVVRDNALAASGLLVRRMGGKGFRPYQPEGLWEAITFQGSNTATYVQDKNEDIYRRSLYMFWKRTSPHPVMLNFDAPMRESCTVRRSRTNTPLQALVTMNEPAFVEASRAMAARLIKKAATDDERIRLAFKLSFGRDASDAEMGLMRASIQRYRTQFALNHNAAHSLLKVGDSPRDPSIPADEHAAWTLICNTLINTDEFLTQH